MTQEEIIQYYQGSQWIYGLVVYNKHTLGMHFGLWDKTTKNRQQAMLNENHEVIRRGSIQQGMRVLDAGCGVGGTVIYIAKTTHAEVWGISIDPKQITLANKYAQKHTISPLTHFSVQDYTHTNFPDNYFDVVYGIESICHASPKQLFLRETFRILKPGGKLIILDGYASRKPITAQEKRILSEFSWAWALPHMITNTFMCNAISRTGFIKTNSVNFTKEVLPTARYFRMFGLMTWIVCNAAKYIPIEPIHAIYRNYLAFVAIEKAYAIGLASYWLEYAEKPLRNANRNTPTQRAKEKF